MLVPTETGDVFKIGLGVFCLLVKIGSVGDLSWWGIRKGLLKVQDAVFIGVDAPSGVPGMLFLAGLLRIDEFRTGVFLLVIELIEGVRCIALDNAVVLKGVYGLLGGE